MGWLTGGALFLVVIGGILMASYAPRKAPLGIATTLILGDVLLMVAAGWLCDERRISCGGPFEKYLMALAGVRNQRGHD